jgi:WD40 repeat protein
MLKKYLVPLFILFTAALGAQEAPVVDYVDHYTCAVWSDDSNYILAGTRDGGLRLWDVWQKREALSIAAHNAAVRSAAFTHDGGRLVSASDDGSLKVWDAATGRLLSELKGHSGSVLSVAVSPGRYYSAGADKTIRVWDAVSGKTILTLTGHGGEVNSVSLDSAGKFLCSASADRTIKLWDAATGRLLRTLTGHAGAVNSAAMSGDGKMIFSGGNDKTTRLWDAETGNEINKFEEKQIPRFVAFSGDGRNMASALGGEENIVKIYRISESEPKGDRYWDYTYNDIADKQKAAAFGSGGKFLLLCNENGFIDVCVLMADTYNSELTLTRLDHLEALSVADNGRAFAGSRDAAVRVWDTARGRQTMLLQGHYKGIKSLALSPDGKTLLSGSEDLTIKQWDTANGKELKTLTGMRGWITLLSYSRDGNHVICYDGSQRSWTDVKNVFVWDTATWRPRGIYYSRFLNALLFDHSGKNVFIGSGNEIFKVVDIETGETRHSFEGGGYDFATSPGGDKAAFVFSQNNQQSKQREYYAAVHSAHSLFSGSFDGELWTREIPPGRYSPVFSPDGKQLLCYNGRNLKIFDAAAGRELASVSCKSVSQPFLTAAAFTPDGKKIVAVLDNRTLGVWDAKGREMARLISFSDGEWICITSEGYYTASPKGDTYVKASVGGKNLGLAEYRSRYNKPERVEALLVGR